MKTPAAILVEQRQPLLIDEVELPVLGYGQVLVQVKVSRICGSQLGEIEGVKGPDKYLPHLLGHEGGGIVLEVGPEVSHVQPGDHVVLHWRPGAGIQAAPSRYRLGSQTVNAGNITTFQNLTVVSENRVTRIPAGTDFEVAALLADTLTTGFGAVIRDARVTIGEAVVVIGVGGIGLGTVLGAHLAGAHPVIAVDLHDHKLAKAREFGATHTVNTREETLADAVQRILGGPADAVFDVTGQSAVVEQAWKITGPRGRLVLVGVMRHDQQLSLNTLPLHYGKVLTGSEGGSSQPHRDIPRYLRMIQSGRFDPRGMVSHRGSLQEINSLIATMRSGEAAHSMIIFPD
ncbi:MAG: zinc-binding dehydrogenase [Opitutae bacterium]|nr:zinc-binding dehydrogenase [Opitutae bacterium]